MKHLPSLVLIGALALALRAEAPPTKPAETPAPQQPAPKPAAQASGDPFVKNTDGPAGAKPQFEWMNCLFVLEVYAMDKNDALSVIEGEHGGVARYRRTGDLYKTGKARLETLSALTTRSGQRADLQAIDEVRYPTEFNPPTDEKSGVKPSAWEVRNAGDTFEVEPVIAENGQECTTNMEPQRVSLAGFRESDTGPGDVPVSQPVFHNQKLTLTSTGLNGEPVFLGTFTPPASPEDAKANEIWLAFVRTDLQGPTGKEPKPADRPGPKIKTPEAYLQLEYSIFSLDRAEAHDLLGTPAPNGDAWEKVQALAKENKARFEHLTTLLGRSGQRVAAEEVREERYWTEAVPGARDATVENTTRSIQSGPMEDPNKVDQKRDYSRISKTTEITTVRHEDANAPRLPGYAQAFETRNTGFGVEAEALVGPDWVTVDINHAILQTALLGSLKTPGVGEKYPWQPLFETRKVTTSQTVPLGVHTLVSTLNPPGADGVNGRADTGRTWLLFVRATRNSP